MSAWDAYISQNLMCTFGDQGHSLDSAAIIGLDGGVWAHSEHFPSLSSEQIATLVSGFTDISVTAFTLGDVKYQRIPGDETILRGRKGPSGFVVKKTGQSMVVGFYTDPVSAVQCSEIVETLGNYLVDTGY